MEGKSRVNPLELSVALTEKLLDESESESLPEKADFESIPIEDDENDPLSLFGSVEVNQLLQEQRRYARQILNTFYAMALCILIYTIAHTGALLFMHFCGN